MEGHLTRADLAYILQETGTKSGLLSINFDPLDPLAKLDTIATGAVPVTTYLLTLNEAFDSVERGFSKMVQRHVRHAIKQGVVTRRGQGVADFIAYFGLTQLAKQRWGLEAPPFPLALYHAFSTLPPEQISLWLAEYEGQTVGGLISLHYTPGRVYYWGSAMHPQYVHLNPTKLLQWEAIREACQRGATIYNMGPSAGFDSRPLEGVRQAKEALGARPFDYAVVILVHPWAMRLRAVRDRMRRLVGRSN
jgi:lipid II:glycine glycyltransferase (peptidoglycan interpeptide bridge formation enzyme)